MTQLYCAIRFFYCIVLYYIEQSHIQFEFVRIRDQRNVNNVFVKVSCSMHESTGVEITFTVVLMTCYTVPVNKRNTSIFIFIMSSSSCLHMK
jgi:hypothetical protein